MELGEIVRIKRNSIKPENIKNETFYVGLEHINNLGVVNGVFIKNGELASNKFLFNKGDILYGKLRPYLKKISLATKDGICSTDIIPIKVKPNVSPNYVCHLLRSDRMVNEANSRTSGANLPRISPKEIVKLKIPLPSLAEQKRIANILDQADQLRQLNQQVLEQYDVLTQSLFLDMFGRLDGEKMKLSDLCIINPKKSEIKETDKETFISFVPMGNVSVKGNLNLSEERKIEDVWSGFTYFREDDISFAKITPCMENGKGAIMRGLKNEIGFGTTEFHILRPIKNITTPEWIYHLTVLPFFRELAKSNMTGSGGQKRVPKTFFNKFKVVCPPLELQNKFAQKIKNIEAQKAVAKTALANSEDLFKNLLQKAFKGEL